LSDAKAHGRLTHHELRAVAVEAETIGLPFARAVVSVTRTSQSTKAGAEPKTGVRIFVTSLDPDKTPPEHIAALVRSHWGIENKNHWKRDAQWGEDAPRQRNSATAMALAVLRGALLPLIREPCPALFARCRRRMASALRLLKSPLKPLK
jgi:predicted transposase YbfD/YdcC